MGKNGNLDLSHKNGGISFISATTSAKNAAISSKNGRSRSSAKRVISGRSLQPPAMKVCCALKCTLGVAAAPASKRIKKQVIRCRFSLIPTSTNTYTSSIYGFVISIKKALCELAAWRADLGLTSTKKDSSFSIKHALVWRKKFSVMKIMEQNIKTLLWLLAALFLVSCSTSKHLQDPAPAAAQSQQQIIYLRDTTFLEGETKTIVEHDTVNGKPILVTTTTTKTKTIRLMGQTKIVRDTLFLPSKLIKAQTAAITKAQKNKGSKRKFPYKIVIPFLPLLIFFTIIIFAYVKQYFSFKSVLKRIKVVVEKAASVAARYLKFL